MNTITVAVAVIASGLWFSIRVFTEMNIFVYRITQAVRNPDLKDLEWTPEWTHHPKLTGWAFVSFVLSVIIFIKVIFS
jgi:mannose/fructose/N-acetylgalactosamine-specific phosphotransferase system component IIC